MSGPSCRFHVVRDNALYRVLIVRAVAVRTIARRGCDYVLATKSVDAHGSGLHHSVYLHAGSRIIRGV